MNNMFDRCILLEKILNFPKNKTSNVALINFMFAECKKLKIDPNNQLEFDYRKITNMSFMFYKCESINKQEVTKLLNIDKFKKADKTCIFEGCEKNGCYII